MWRGGAPGAMKKSGTWTSGLPDLEAVAVHAVLAELLAVIAGHDDHRPRGPGRVAMKSSSLPTYWSVKVTSPS